MSSLVRPGVAAGAAVVLALVVAASAAATIVPGQGMAGVRLGMTESQVRVVLGNPMRVTHARGALGVLVTRLHYTRLDVDLQRLNRKKPVVVLMLTTGSREHTASGVGVGSTLSAVERLSGAHCWWEETAHYCGIGNRDKPLSRFTMFWISVKQRVTLISIALITNS